MSWPAKRPAFLPAAAWEAARALHDRVPPLSAAEAGALERLLGADVANAWRTMARRARGADPAAWRLLLKLFVQSVPGSSFRPKELRARLAEAPLLLAKIAKQARSLAALLDQLAELERAHALQGARSLDLLSLLEHSEYELLRLLTRAGYENRMSEASQTEHLCLELDGVVPALLRELAAATDDTRAVPCLPHDAYALAQKCGALSDWVRYVDYSHRLYFAPCLPAGLRTLTDTELAALGSAVLDREVSRETVRNARATTPEDLLYGPSAVLFPIRDDAP